MDNFSLSGISLTGPSSKVPPETGCEVQQCQPWTVLQDVNCKETLLLAFFMSGNGSAHIEDRLVTIHNLERKQVRGRGGEGRWREVEMFSIRFMCSTLCIS